MRDTKYLLINSNAFHWNALMVHLQDTNNAVWISQVHEKSIMFYGGGGGGGRRNVILSFLTA